MAGADYLCCEECGARLCYDGDKTIREKLEWKPLFCEKCFIKMKKKRSLLEKHNRQSDTELLIEFCDCYSWLIDVDVVNAIKRLQYCHYKQLQDYEVFEDKENNQD